MKMVALITTKVLDPPEDGRADVIRNLIRIFLEEKRYRVQQGQRLANQFTWERTASKTLELYGRYAQL